MSIELTDAGRNEYEALVRDAKRYRWLREAGEAGEYQRGATILDDGRPTMHLAYWVTPDKLDISIDTAIAAYKKRQEGVK